LRWLARADNDVYVADLAATQVKIADLERCGLGDTSAGVL
jgi:hypothetical protein